MKFHALLAVYLLAAMASTFSSCVDAANDSASRLNRRNRRGGSGSKASNYDSSERRHLKGSKYNYDTLTVTVDTEGSCTSQANLYTCDVGHVAICYEHENHFHNKCVPVDSGDIFGKVPGIDYYKNEDHPLINCGCCDLDALTVSRGTTTYLKYPKGYADDPYCDRLTPAPSSGPSASPSIQPSSLPSRGGKGGSKGTSSPSSAPSPVPSRYVNRGKASSGGR